MLKKILLFIFLFFSACALKNQDHYSKNIMVLLNTPSLKMNDFAFLKREDQTLKLELYKLGQVFSSLKIRDNICLNALCYEKKIFNQKFLKNIYYDELLEHILEAKPLWSGKNLQSTDCGFTQKLSGLSYEIFYEVCGNKTSFTDSISHVRIVLMHPNE